MTIQKAKETVILAGNKLVESGLIARTWGNISCRISNSHFVITPSGRDYISLTPADIVEVSISDCSYTGTIKPSSEKGIHAEVYKLHPEVNFVIHTHQIYASVISVLSLDSINVKEDFPLLGGEVILADYGLPGTKKLRRNVAKALALSKGNAVILKNHGALCFGRDSVEAFKVAQELEYDCKQFLMDHCHKISDNMAMSSEQIGHYSLTKLTEKFIDDNTDFSSITCESQRTKNGFMLIIGDKTLDLPLNGFENTASLDDNLHQEIKIHTEIYKNHKQINNIIHTNVTDITTVSRADLRLYPLLDDFAQIAGTSIKTVEMNANKISYSLKRASAVFIKNNGALCCSSTKGDAQAVSMVLEKNCKALIFSALFGKVKYINPLECQLMRYIYLKKYSKQAYTNLRLKSQ